MMRKGLLCGVAAWLVGAAQLLGQTPSAGADPKDGPESNNLVQAPAVVEFSSPRLSPDSLRYWARAEFLLWWVRNAPLPIPIVTTGDPTVGLAAGVNTAGAIGQPGTQVLLGADSGMSFRTSAGGRLTLGGWLGQDDLIGWEASAFLLARRTSHFEASSDAAGNPPLYFPSFNTATNDERALPIADPLRQFSGSVLVTSTLQFWGAELNGVVCLWRQPGLEVTFLAGFRYVDLKENLQIQNPTNDLIFLNTQTATDHFDTRNQFYGGQIGARASWQRERLSLDVTGKLALGSTHQVVNIQGDSSEVLLPGAPVATFPGGIFALPSNSGRRTENQFGVIPSL